MDNNAHNIAQVHFSADVTVSGNKSNKPNIMSEYIMSGYIVSEYIVSGYSGLWIGALTGEALRPRPFGGIPRC